MSETNSSQTEIHNKTVIKMEAIKKNCFVITPIGENNSEIRRHIDGVINAAIRPALSENYEVRVAHEFTSPGSINKQVIVEIYNSDLVIANLTNLNPNVMYELAIRHALKKPVIMIMEEGNIKLPFDVVAERTIFYKNDFQGVLDLKNEIIKAEMALNDINISNPIFDALNSFVADESLIKNIESKDKGQADVLKTILNKINALEGSINNEKVYELASSEYENRIRINIQINYAEEFETNQINDINNRVLNDLQMRIMKEYGWKFLSKKLFKNNDEIEMTFIKRKNQLWSRPDVNKLIGEQVQSSLNSLNVDAGFGFSLNIRASV
ncbi:hypothetical protein [uncultured Clostridium sp.]|uniref:hypothetical protein n=1 Tax=uncultured Clostridium sp. TaxID=59620 RepID=UPI0028E31951|nr:hypothetical protein [uncultured Clostridium sp.]